MPLGKLLWSALFSEQRTWLTSKIASCRTVWLHLASANKNKLCGFFCRMSGLDDPVFVKEPVFAMVGFGSPKVVCWTISAVGLNALVTADAKRKVCCHRASFTKHPLGGFPNGNFHTFLGVENTNWGVKFHLFLYHCDPSTF